jgi:pseudouridine-5'-phosphate glycosidase
VAATPTARPDVAAPVAAALEAGQPVVALESTLITHGLPAPDNLEVALAAEAAVERVGALPATICVRDGSLAVGLSRAELETLARLAGWGAPKASRHNLAAVLARGGWAGTTVSATMIAAHQAGIRVFATGGIGGVHRGAATSFDISADLEELARTPVAVVCSGPKSILDAAATLEYLETRGVPVIGLGTDELPGFYSRSSGLPVPIVARDVTEAATIVRRHVELGLGSGVVLAVPVPEAAALPREEAEAAVERAWTEAEEAAIRGPATTPWLLARVAELTEGRSQHANRALIEHNAEVAGELAVALGRDYPAASNRYASTSRTDA